MIVKRHSLRPQSADLSTITVSSAQTQSASQSDLWSTESKECFSAQFAESIGRGDNKGRGIKTADQCLHVCLCVKQLCPFLFDADPPSNRYAIKAPYKHTSKFIWHRSSSKGLVNNPMTWADMQLQHRSSQESIWGHWSLCAARRTILLLSSLT